MITTAGRHVSPLVPPERRAARRAHHPPPTSLLSIWKYPRPPGGLARYATSFLVSVALHALLVFGPEVFTTEAPPPVVVEEEAVVQMEMPPIPVEELEPPPDLISEVEEASGVYVPTLTDIPTRVAVATDFVQAMQPHVEVDPAAMVEGLSRIPVQIAHRPAATGQMKDLFDFSQLDRQPQALAQPPPVFPLHLRHQTDRATVLVEFIVDTGGRVLGARVISSTHGDFDRFAMEGVERWRFQPGMKSGRIVNTRMRVPVIFTVVDK
jgi:periplasmic protein TonB